MEMLFSIARCKTYFLILMKRFFLLVSILIGGYTTLIATPRFYLLTIAEMNDVYALYGHSAIRVLDTATNNDFIVDWGVFDFNQPNFYTNFTSGKMLYTTNVQPYELYLRQNYYFKKGVTSREIILNETQSERLLNLILLNLEPQNRNYYYKFIQDNCATRPRDLLERALGEALIYPDGSSESKTFRDILHDFQYPHAWYNFLIDIVLGSRIDKKAGFREQMFIPMYLENNLAQAMVQDSSGVQMHPLLSAPTVVIEKVPLKKTFWVYGPELALSMLLILVLTLGLLKKGRKFLRIFDICFFGIIIFFGLGIMLLWGLSLHTETYDNYNLFWLNPLFVLPLIALRAKRKIKYLIFTAAYVLVFATTALCGAYPQSFPASMYIVLAIVLARCFTDYCAKKALFEKS